MRVVAWWDGKTKIFNSVVSAASYFQISPNRVEWCIKTGHKWRGVFYDEALND